MCPRCQCMLLGHAVNEPCGTVAGPTKVLVHGGLHCGSHFGGGGLPGLGAGLLRSQLLRCRRKRPLQLRPHLRQREHIPLALVMVKPMPQDDARVSI